MMKKLLLLLLPWCLCSCAMTQYGNFTCIDTAKDTVIVKDAVKQVRRIKVPARTTFYIYQSTKDSFGIQLVQALRKQGFGVQENTRPKSAANFAFILDRISAQNLYRLSLILGSQKLSRVYLIQQGKVIPLGQWSHKE